jgi:hypothetical protein
VHVSRHARRGSYARHARHARGGPAAFPLLVVLLARLVGPGALDPAPALSKHWGTRPAAVRLGAVALAVMATALLLLAAMRTGATLTLARWIWF